MFLLPWCVLLIPGNYGKTKATELMACGPALSKGISHKAESTKEASVDSQSVPTAGHIASSEMQGRFQTVLPGRVSLGHDSLGRSEGVCSMTVQKHSPPGDATHSCESDKDPEIQEEQSVFK